MAGDTYTFRDLTGRARAVEWLLYANIALAVIGAVSFVMQYSMLTDMMSGALAPGADFAAAAKANKLRQEVINNAQLVLQGALTPLAFLMWVYRANGNVRALGATGMRFTPGWAVGYYFVPVYNLWRPYLAMKEMWKASANPGNWRAERVSPLLFSWWFLWIGMGLYAWVVIIYGYSAKTYAALLDASLLNLSYNVIDIPLCLLLLAVVWRMTRMQMDQATTRPESPVPAPA